MSSPATLIITNARAMTMDPDQPYAEAIAIHGRTITFVGSTAEALLWRGPGTRIIDAAGGTLLPGFIDSHYHLLPGSLELSDIQLATAGSLELLAAALKEAAASRPDEPWLVGRGLRYSVMPPGQPLTRQHLDAIIPGQPLIIFAYDVHTAWANTAALQRANILTGGEVNAPNSEIVRDAAGRATGELREVGAFEQVTRLIPPPGEVRQRELLRQGLTQAAQLGLTSVHNMDGDAAQLALYAALEDLGELTLRVYCPYNATPATPPEALAEAVAWRETYRSDMIRSGAVKFFMDGVIESYTGLLLDDYADRPGCRGGANFSAEQFNRMAVEADRLSLQVFVHAVGDGAVRRVLDGFAAARQANGPRDSRHRIEHIELVSPEDLPRFAELGVIASMQPPHVPLTLDDPDPWPLRVGQERWEWSFAWQSLREAGARLVFGSDWPVAGQNPLVGLHAALNRQPWRSDQRDQRQTLAEAIAGYTCDAAYAEFQEQRKGRLRAGLLADLVLLSADLETPPAEQITEIKPVLTVCDGRIVYEE